MSLEMVSEVWERLGIKSFKPRKDLVLVVTDQTPRTTESGLLYLPPKQTKFYGPLAPPTIKATVLAVGDRVKGLRPGDRIAFSRAFFIRWQEIAPDTMVGWVQGAARGSQVSAVLGRIDLPAPPIPPTSAMDAYLARIGF